MPSGSTLLILALWALVLLGTLSGSFQIPASSLPSEMSLATFATIVLMPVFFSGLISFWIPYSPFYHPKLAHIFDSRFGRNAFASFLVRMKPLLIFAMGASLQGIIGLWQSYTRGAEMGEYAAPGFFLSGGIGFLFTHVVLYFRKVPGVYPVWTRPQYIVNSKRSKLEQKSLGDSLRAYWWTLIGLAVFPTMSMIGEKLMHIPFDFFALPFFAVCLLAVWPSFTKRAPYSFWIVACGVWLLGGIIAAILWQLIRILKT
jgi:hypothetical protein